MHFLTHKLAAVKFVIPRKRRPVALALLLSAAPILWQGCATRPVVIETPIQATPIDNSFVAKPRQIAPDLYQSIRQQNQIDIFGPEHLIMEVQEPVRSMNYLFGPNIISFRTANMPQDMERILKRYAKNDEYGNFYNYVCANVQIINLCPHIIFDNQAASVVVYGLTALDVDKSLYPAERSVYINNLYQPRISRPMIIKLADVVHETAHVLLEHWYSAGKLPAHYFRSDDYNERFANLVQAEFVRAAVNDPEFRAIRGVLMHYLYQTEAIIEHFNTILGLPYGDRREFGE